MIDWAAGGAYGVREWMEAIQDSALAAFETEPFPEVDVALLLEPLEGAVIEVPAPAGARNQPAAARTQPAVASTQPAERIVVGETHLDSGEATSLHQNFSLLLQQMLQNVAVRQGGAADGRWISSAPPRTPAMPLEQSAGAREQGSRDSMSGTVAGQSSEIPHSSSSVYRNAHESLIQRIEQWIEAAHDADTAPADLLPHREAATMPGRLAVQTQNTRGPACGKPAAATLQHLAGEAWNARPKPAAVAQASAAPQAESLTQALDRLVETIAALETRITVKQAVAPAQPPAPAVRWLDDDDLAGRLQNILKRQARRRGIDLS